MKEVREAYRKGQSGDAGKDVTGKAAKAAHRLGAASFESMQKADMALSATKERETKQAIEVAKGPNKLALEIIRASAGIPNQSSSKPTWGVDSYEKKDPSNRSRAWLGSFVKGVNKDNSRPDKTPVVEDLGVMKVDSTDWSHNGLTIPIDNISISVNADVGEDGQSQSPSTTIWLNTREYYMDDRDYQRGHGDQVRLDFGTNGEVESVGLSAPNMTGYKDEDASKVTTNIDEVLSNVLSSVQSTAQVYSELQDEIG